MSDAGKAMQVHRLSPGDTAQLVYRQRRAAVVEHCMALRPRLGEGFSGHSGVLSAAKRMPTVLQTADPNPSEYPPTCGYSIPRRVKTAFCPCGVRSPGVCLVSATQVLDHVPSSPAESCCISSSHCCPEPGRHAAEPPACRSPYPPLPPAGYAPGSVPPWKSDLHGHHRSHPRLLPAIHREHRTPLPMNIGTSYERGRNPAATFTT